MNLRLAPCCIMTELPSGIYPISSSTPWRQPIKLATLIKLT